MKRAIFNQYRYDNIETEKSEGDLGDNTGGVAISPAHDHLCSNSGQY